MEPSLLEPGAFLRLHLAEPGPNLVHQLCVFPQINRALPPAFAVGKSEVGSETVAVVGPPAGHDGPLSVQQATACAVNFLQTFQDRLR